MENTFQVMKRVLIITYYWVPSGGSGVQRWVKFAKYLRQFGWEPIIYTPLNPEFPAIDKSLEKDLPTDLQVIKMPIWEPYNIYRNLTGKKNQPINAGFISEGKKQGWKDKLSIWIRGNFLIPDPRRFWIKPSVRYLQSYIQDNPVDAIITTGPPHSIHFIGLGLKKHFPNLPWMADFRDPWTNIYYHSDLQLTKWADAVHHRLEKQIVQGADTVLVVSTRTRDEFAKHKPKAIELITNGYDSEDAQQLDVKLDSKFSIAHIGLFIESQNPKKLWKVLSELCTELPDFATDLHIHLIGKIDFSIIQHIKQAGLEANATIAPYMPHADVIKIQHASQVLLLLLVNKPNTESVIPGKLFEYFNARRPILAIGHTNGDSAALINSTGAGAIVDFDDEKSLKSFVVEAYQQYKKGTLTCNSSNIEQYSRRNLTHKLSNILNTLSQK